MPKLLINDSHFFLTSHQDIDKIISPLKEHLDISSFVYQMNNNNGAEFRLSNQPTWIKYYFDHEYSHISSFEKHPDQYQSGIILWSSLIQHQPILQAAREFKIDHGVTFIKKMSDGIEYFFLGTTPDKPYVPNLILNNSDFLSRFFIYFKERAALLIQEAKQHQIIIPNKYKIAQMHELILYQKNLNPEKILPLKKFQIDNNLALSTREITCAKLLLQGKSARLIADQLFLSRRTVESHIQNLKNKLSCDSKPTLIEKLTSINVASF